MVKSDNIISPEKEEIIKSVLEVLGEPYQYARDMHIHTEIATFKRDWVGMYNLRDAFDHLRKLLIYLFEDDDNNKAEGEKAEMEAHLYRAILEGAQNVTEVYLDRIGKKLKPRILYRLSFVDAPSEAEITCYRVGNFNFAYRHRYWADPLNRKICWVFNPTQNDKL